jgi:hypothetical protein
MNFSLHARVAQRPSETWLIVWCRAGNCCGGGGAGQVVAPAAVIGRVNTSKIQIFMIVSKLQNGGKEQLHLQPDGCPPLTRGFDQERDCASDWRGPSRAWSCQLA